jgi:hypothetical protein
MFELGDDPAFYAHTLKCVAVVADTFEARHRSLRTAPHVFVAASTFEIVEFAQNYGQ